MPSISSADQATADGEGWRDGKTVDQPLPNHHAALRLVSDFLSESFGRGVGQDCLHSVGHRVVHGGPSNTAPALITRVPQACLLACLPACLPPLLLPAARTCPRPSRRPDPTPMLQAGCAGSHQGRLPPGSPAQPSQPVGH